MEIADLNLSVRDFNAVKRFGIQSTEELIERLPNFCKEHQRTGAKVTEALHKLGLMPFHLGEWVEPERCAEELAPEELLEGAFIILPSKGTLTGIMNFLRDIRSLGPYPHMMQPT